MVRTREEDSSELAASKLINLYHSHSTGDDIPQEETWKIAVRVPQKNPRP
jgi:hypothetical protein